MFCNNSGNKKNKKMPHMLIMFLKTDFRVNFTSKKDNGLQMFRKKKMLIVFIGT